VQPILAATLRIRHPDLFSVGEGSIVDDFCYFSTAVRIGRLSHVANNCSIAGGRAHTFTLGDMSSLSAGVRVWCHAHDFVNDLVCLVPPGVDLPKDDLIEGDVAVGHYTAIGANTVIMPAVVIPDGTVVGALSYVAPRTELAPWSVYAGVPARRIKARDRDAVLREVERLERALRG
jgi:acetyltransferase-like isoleucine patch superfamily enzyme